MSVEWEVNRKWIGIAIVLPSESFRGYDGPALNNALFLLAGGQSEIEFCNTLLLYAALLSAGTHTRCDPDKSKAGAEVVIEGKGV